MTGLQSFFIIVCGGLLIGLVAGLILRKQGYSFVRYFVTGFLAGSGILGIIVKIVRDYL
jgi:predicted branched-subunit amino acid permease